MPLPSDRLAGSSEMVRESARARTMEIVHRQAKSQAVSELQREKSLWAHLEGAVLQIQKPRPPSGASSSLCTAHKCTDPGAAGTRRSMIPNYLLTHRSEGCPRTDHRTQNTPPLFCVKNLFLRAFWEFQGLEALAP